MQKLMTNYGELIPQHTTDTLRKREVLPVEYHENGTPKAVPLEEQTVIETPVGPIPAEMVTFHENGTLNRLFPLNGRLSGYWGEEDEAGLAEPVTIATPAGSITSRIIGIAFYDTGALRSITLWPGDNISVVTPVGKLKARVGISFTPDGQLRSLEPAEPTPLQTRIGEITAFDPDAMGVNGDNNSLEFDSNGGIRRISTVITEITATRDDKTIRYTPGCRESLCGNTETEPVPMTVTFSDTTVTVKLSPEEAAQSIPLDSTTFRTNPVIREFMGSIAMGGGCSGHATTF